MLTNEFQEPLRRTEGNFIIGLAAEVRWHRAVRRRGDGARYRCRRADQRRRRLGLFDKIEEVTDSVVHCDASARIAEFLAKPDTLAISLHY
ncbi:hypothetical protein ACRQ5Q_10390 [Bradyrhizobium sp. PMVTL-01]|uniref:hypothetical protein n=1 Tax=Bradyrhizobium sp. PMVTL-01 TaxID=3434999 RepID=UPI003F709BB4